MNLTEATDYVAAVIDEAVDVPVIVTAGRAAHPNPGACEDGEGRVHVWFDTLRNESASRNEYVQAVAVIAYETIVCYDDPNLEATIPALSHEAAALSFEDLASLTWCAVVNADRTACDVWRPDSMRVQPRQGGIVSAIGEVVVSVDCVTGSSAEA